jgi:hypothetical protein
MEKYRSANRAGRQFERFFLMQGLDINNPKPLDSNERDKIEKEGELIETVKYNFKTGKTEVIKNYD